MREEEGKAEDDVVGQGEAYLREKGLSGEEACDQPAWRGGVNGIGQRR